MLILLFLCLMFAAWAYVCGMAFISLVFINRSSVSRHVFSGVFCLYCLIFAMLFIEIIEISPGTTKPALGVLVVIGALTNCAVTPLLAIQSMFIDFGFGKKMSVLATTAALACIFYTCRSLVALDWGAILTLNLISGSVCNGILSGFAAVNTPYNFLFPVISQGRIKRANKVIDALVKRQKLLLDTWCLKRRKMNSELLENSTCARGFTLSKLIKTFKGNSVEMECEGMSNVSLAIFLEIDELSAFARKNIDSLPARYFNLAVGTVVSIFGISKIASTLISMGFWVFKAKGEMSVNPINRADGFASQIGMITNGVMMMMSLRGFLLAVFRLSTKITGSLATRTATLFFTSAFGVFAMSQYALSVRFLAPSHRNIVFDTCGHFSPDTYSPWNSISFLVAATAAFSLRFIWASTAATD